MGRLLYAAFAAFFLCNSSVLAQTTAGIDECETMDAKAVILAAQQYITDSLTELHIRPEIKVNTVAEAIPLGYLQNTRIHTGKDFISGYFNQLANASHYLVVASMNGDVSAPVDGIWYKTGDRLGSGNVISLNPAAAFTANGLAHNTTYCIQIFAANDQSVKGIVYNPTAVYKAKITTGTGTTLNYYYGTLHSHSSYSDGNKDNTTLVPADDYAYAKNSMCMDFLGISEHNHYSSAHNPGMHVADYAKGIYEADTFTANNPGFLAMYAMEWGVINNGGHVNVYGIDSLIGWETLSGKPNYDIYVGEYTYKGTGGLFDVINKHVATHAFASLAHPDNSDYSNLLGTSYDSAADAAIVGCAIESGPAFSTNTTYSDPAGLSYLSYYTRLLSKGYHLGPWIDHDTHNLTFGRATHSRLVVLSPSLDKNDFLDAVRSMHFYASEYCNTEVDLEVNGNMMGSIVTDANAPSITITATNTTSSSTPKINLYSGTPGSGTLATIIATTNAGTLTYTDNALANNTSAYYYADITIDGHRTLSSPVWYTRNDATQTAVSIVHNEMINTVEIKGNPVQNEQLQLAIYTPAHQEVQIAIMDISGRIILTKVTAVHEGKNNISVALNGLAKGAYVVTTQFAQEKISKMIVK